MHKARIGIEDSTAPGLKLSRRLEIETKIAWVMLRRGKFSNEMMQVIASSLRELHKKDLLVFTNGQHLGDVEFENGKLVIQLVDRGSTDDIVSARQEFLASSNPDRIDHRPR